MNNYLRILFFADTHLGFDYPLRPRIVRRRRGYEFFNNYHRVLSYARDHNVDFILHGGDLFFRTRVPEKIITLVYQPLLKTAQAGIPIYIVPGNHERSRLPRANLIKHSNIHIYKEPQTISRKFSGIKVALSGFPYQRNIRDRFRKVLDQTSWYNHSADLHLLCIHQVVEGAQVGVHNYTFKYGNEVIRRNSIPQGFSAILAGHIHRQQILIANNGAPVIYPGSIERTSFAERGEEKGFYMIEFGPKPEGQWKIRILDFIPLPTRPMFDLKLSENEIAPGNLKAIIQTELANLDPNSIVRIQYPTGNINGVQNTLTSTILRTIAPQTMNIEIRSNRTFQRKNKFRATSSDQITFDIQSNLLSHPSRL